jgi:hypothetical protein
MIYRLDGALKDALKEGPEAGKPRAARLFGFEFNPDGYLQEKLKKELLFNWSQKGTLLITIPELDLPKDLGAPSGTQSVHWNFVVTGSSLDFPTCTGQFMTTITMPYTSGKCPERIVELPVAFQSGSLVVVALSIRYEKDGTGRVTEPCWMPGCIVEQGLGEGKS